MISLLECHPLIHLIHNPLNELMSGSYCSLEAAVRGSNGKRGRELKEE
jgi:hypothetical protein